MLQIEGFKYRTSGGAIPFDQFEKFIEPLLGKEEALPLPETSLVVEEIEDDRLTILLRQEGGETKRIILKDEETIRVERGILGMEIRLTLLK